MADYISIAEIVVVPITIAMITAGSSLILMVKSNKKQSEKMKVEAAVFRDENTSQHNDNKTLLSHLSGQISGIDKKVDRLDERLDNVQVWQANHEITHLSEEQKNISDS
jgi:cell division protein FtsX